MSTLPPNTNSNNEGKAAAFGVIVAFALSMIDPVRLGFLSQVLTSFGLSEPFGPQFKNWLIWEGVALIVLSVAAAIFYSLSERKGDASGTVSKSPVAQILAYFFGGLAGGIVLAIIFGIVGGYLLAYIIQGQ